CARRGENFDYW
nr:immunoglobulin heavy chain junction region [Macaca mulatta]MOV35810.1 immunoglobulin heavy chain junction region [Macaca mulatta]MOV35829.1 immunoglobulin heavy chain junction region [Macaca mulatta]MOV35916.1 immunoglobulin heavy chain junction region [Macaca mulatta]MOV35956.1 immunoglobulin heavy chain junction region [Macaca mulatta]